MAGRMDSLTVLVPVYNEEAVIDEFYRRTVAVCESLDRTQFEILFVDDGSSDESCDIISGLIAKDPRLSLLRLSRNFGKEAALTAGLDHVDADATVIIDADLQDPRNLFRTCSLSGKKDTTLYMARERSGTASLSLKS